MSSMAYRRDEKTGGGSKLPDLSCFVIFYRVLPPQMGVDLTLVQRQGWSGCWMRSVSSMADRRPMSVLGMVAVV